jgi:hypothetical protein
MRSDHSERLTDEEADRVEWQRREDRMTEPTEWLIGAYGYTLDGDTVGYQVAVPRHVAPDVTEGDTDPLAIPGPVRAMILARLERFCADAAGFAAALDGGTITWRAAPISLPRLTSPEVPA